MLVTDRKVCDDLLWAVERALQGGIRLVQLRERDLSAQDLLTLARKLREMTKEWEAMLLVNDRVDVALLSEADGVHLGEAALSVADARKLMPSGALITAAAHSVERARFAAQSGASAVVLGTIFPTDSKPGIEPAGLSLLQAAVASMTVPVYAIGGIDRDKVPAVLKTGAYGVAVIRAVLAQNDPLIAARELQEAVQAYCG
jgi:thiamine-phosphate pyrophosphorylase